jgi:two-component system response regulator FixJ
VIYLVDDDADIRWVLAEAVRPLGHKVAEFASAAAFLAARDKDAPGCLVTDLRMPGMDGCQLLEVLSDRGDPLPAVVLTAHADIPTTVKIMRAGGLDVLEKPAESAAILAAVKRALSRDGELRAAAGGAAAVSERLARLTPRERQVFELVVLGKISREIAADLGISVNTVEIHRTRVMRKMEAGTVAELVRMALGVGTAK